MEESLLEESLLSKAIDTVEKLTGISQKEWMNKTSKQDVVLARCILVGLLENLGYGNNVIIPNVNRTGDHTQVIHYRGKIKLDHNNLKENIATCEKAVLHQYTSKFETFAEKCFISLLGNKGVFDQQASAEDLSKVAIHYAGKFQKEMNKIK